MGRMTTETLADCVIEGGIAFEKALGLHLTSNFYPPLPGGYVKPLVEAIQAVWEDDGARLIALPDVPLLPRSAEKIEGIWYVDADSLVESCKAWPFVDSADYDED